MRFTQKLIGLATIAAVLLVIGIFPSAASAQQTPGTSYSAFSGAFAAPAISGVGNKYANYTAGNLYQGGLTVSITAGSATISDTSKSNCTGPTFTSCEFLYWASGTSLLATSSYNTAFAGGANIIAAYLTLDGSSNILTIVPASLNLPDFPLPASNCSTSATCATPVNITGNLKWVTGTVAMSSATTVGVSGVPAIFTSATSFGVIVVNANGHAYTSGAEVTSTTAFTIVSGTSNSDTWTWIAIGYYLDRAHDKTWGAMPRRFIHNEIAELLN